jgi:hypothetical protein
MSSNQGNLEWNSALSRYQAIVDGVLVEVDSDEFSEVEAVHLQDALDKGLSPEAAEKKAWDETRWAGGWLNTHAVTEQFNS